MDTQWPRFQVFLQEKAGEPHQDVGSVHAPDVELALLNARDVFVRRPQCNSLWVAPAEAIFSKTAEELEDGIYTSEANETFHKQPEPFYVFCKEKPAGTCTHVDTILALQPAEALTIAVKNRAGAKAPFVWWVIPARMVLQSDLEDIGPLFEPSLDKPFRLSTTFHTHSSMRKVKGER